MQQELPIHGIPSLILNHIDTICLLTDEHHKVLYVNDLFFKYFGQTLTVGELFCEIQLLGHLSTSDKDAVCLLYKTNLLEQKKNFEFEFQLKTKEENKNWYKIISKAIQLENEKFYFLHLISDIHQQKSREAKLEIAKETAVENDRLKSAFLANMSHEIRTPMNTIIGFTRLLAESKDPDEKVQFADIVKINSDHLLQLINDIIDVSKIEAGFHDIKLLSANINDVLNDVQKLFIHDKRAKSKDLQLEIELGLSHSDANILTDDTRLKQVVINLIDNAIKFTQRGKISFGYKLISETYNDGTAKLLFYVKDTGLGIPKNEIKLIFERFHQIDDENKKNGTGLGLTIVNALVRKLGGDVWVESELGKGSTFYFTIPYLQKKQEIIKESVSKSFENTPDFEGKVLLIAEDIPTDYKYLEALLKKTKAKLIWVTNGKDAVNEVVKNNKIHLVLMDLKMPVMNGYNATKQIKLLHPKLPVIAVTAFAINGDMEKAFDFGCDEYITKPIMREELYKKIKVFLE